MSVLLTIISSIAVGWVAHKLSVRAIYKQSQLEWLKKTYIEFVNEVRTFNAGSSSGDQEKKAIANKIIGTYHEAIIYAAPEVVKKLHKLIKLFGDVTTDSDKKADAVRDVILSMRKQLQ